MSVVKRLIPWHESPHGGPLGRNVEHDPRSYAFKMRADTSVPLHFANHIRHGKILDQGDLGSCTGNALVGAVMCGPLWRRYHNYGEVMAVRLYKRATALDAFPGVYPPDDTGSSGLAVCKAAVEKKLILRYEHAFGIDEALQALMRGAVITGIDWYEGFDHPRDSGLVQIDGEIRGGHEVVARSYVPVTGDFPLDGIVVFDNSWGGSWGRKGSFNMTARTWAALLEAQGDVTVPLR